MINPLVIARTAAMLATAMFDPTPELRLRGVLAGAGPTRGTGVTTSGPTGHAGPHARSLA